GWTRSSLLPSPTAGICQSQGYPSPSYVGQTPTKAQAAVRLPPFVHSYSLRVLAWGDRYEPRSGRRALQAGHGKGEGTLGAPVARSFHCGRREARSTVRPDPGTTWQLARGIL